MVEEFCLSEKIIYQEILPNEKNGINVNGLDCDSWRMQLLTIEDVKEFIRLLKEELAWDTKEEAKFWCKKIDKLAGDKLL